MRLIKLLNLYSSKLSERFVNLRTAFRFFDTDHSGSLSVNEFANVADYLRLKVSFDDISSLYRFLDRSGRGAIIYDDFLMLVEENWRGCDPYEIIRENQLNREAALKADSTNNQENTNRSSTALSAS